MCAPALAVVAGAAVLMAPAGVVAASRVAVAHALVRAVVGAAAAPPCVADTGMASASDVVGVAAPDVGSLVRELVVDVMVAAGVAVA